MPPEDAEPPVEAVLWDADGVLQHLPAGWEASMRPVVGHLVEDVETFLAEAFAAERPALTGQARWLDVLPGLLERWGIPDAFDDALEVWLTIEPVAATRELVAAVRAAGVACYLATNQDEHRGRFMQERLARGVGLRAERWHVDDGADVLSGQLRAHGLPG